MTSGQPTDQKAGGSNPSRRAIWQETRNPSGCGFFLYSCGFVGILACAWLTQIRNFSDAQCHSKRTLLHMDLHMKTGPIKGRFLLFFTPPDSLSPHTCYSSIVVVHQDVNVVSSHLGIQCSICLIPDNHRCAGGNNAGVCCSAVVDPIVLLTLIVLCIPPKFSNRS